MRIIHTFIFIFIILSICTLRWVSSVFVVYTALRISRDNTNTRYFENRTRLTRLYYMYKNKKKLSCSSRTFHPHQNANMYNLHNVEWIIHFCSKIKIILYDGWLDCGLVIRVPCANKWRVYRKMSIIFFAISILYFIIILMR